MSIEQIAIVISALLFVLMLLLALAWLAKRHNWLAPRNKLIDMQIIGSQSLGARCSIAAIKVEDQCLVIGITPQNINLLHSMPVPEHAISNKHSNAATTAAFAKILKQVKSND